MGGDCVRAKTIVCHFVVIAFGRSWDHVVAVVVIAGVFWGVSL